MGWRDVSSRTVLCLSLTLFFVLTLLLFTHQKPVPVLKAAEKLHLLAPPDSSYFPPTPDLCANETITNEDLCASFPKEILDKVQITIKTGIGERHRLEAVLASYGSCISNLLVVSDVEDVLDDGHQIHDILADLPATYAFNNSDWHVYEEQLQELAAGEMAPKSAAGWKLDSYKFLPMVEYAHAQSPNAEWYVFIEADTYMFWDTLFRVLEKLDAKERHYLGAATPGAWDRWFAYGGAGFVLSQGLLRDLTLIGDQRLSAKYEDWAKPECCGDALLAYVLHAELGVRIGTIFPTLSGDEPEWAGIWRENLCTPVASLHHVSAESMRNIWHWERCRRVTYPARPVTLAAIQDYTLAPVLTNGTDVRANWNSGASKKLSSWSTGHASAKACFEHCQEDKKCLQASYAAGECRFGKRARSGRAVDEEKHSFWDLRKLSGMGWHPDGDSSAMCSMIDWLRPKTMRPP